MLFELTEDEIVSLESNNAHAGFALVMLVTEKFGVDKLETLNYPTITEVSNEESWLEFRRCFHVERKAHYADLMRPKYKGGHSWMRPI